VRDHRLEFELTSDIDTIVREREGGYEKVQEPLVSIAEAKSLCLFASSPSFVSDTIFLLQPGLWYSVAH
jgi:hypothetical protein